MPKLCVYARNSAITLEILGAAIAESTDLDAAEARAVANVILGQEPPSYLLGTPNHLALLEQIAVTLRGHGFTVSIGA